MCSELFKSDVDSWAIAEGKYNDLPLLIRFRDKIKEDDSRSGLTQLIQIDWDFESNSSGMPDSKSANEMEVFENRLISALENPKMEHC